MHNVTGVAGAPLPLRSSVRGTLPSLSPDRLTRRNRTVDRDFANPWPRLFFLLTLIPEKVQINRKALNVERGDALGPLYACFASQEEGEFGRFLCRRTCALPSKQKDENLFSHSDPGTMG